MFHRTLKPSSSNSFFLFGPRGSGKTTFLKTLFDADSTCIIDLLDPSEEDIFSRNPGELRTRLDALPSSTSRIVIDEIQKVPRLLDVVHSSIESSSRQFILTGSSARKLKHGASNLLAGRAFVYSLFPLTSAELGPSFVLNDALTWGTLPKIFQLSDTVDKSEYLKAYALTYLKEEIAAEQIVRKLDPFRAFLEVDAQTNGKVVNFSKIADDVGVDTKTVQSYFTILEDTLLGFYLPAYHGSVRKQQGLSPKFYLFDTGVKRALERTLSVPLIEQTYAYGEAFEHFIMLEMHRLSSYARNDWQFSFLRTKEGAEIDCIIDRPGRPLALIEIKSTRLVTKRDISTLLRFADDFPGADFFCLSCDRHAKNIGPVKCRLWSDGLDELGFFS